MSRFRRMAHNVASSYAALVAASLFSLATVPLALCYLGREDSRFSLWLLMSTIMGYMSLIDLGMSGSVARLLIDQKDQKETGEYGGLIKTGSLVLLVQAAIIVSAGVGLAPLIAAGLNIQPELRTEFIRLLGWQSGALALAFGLRIFSHILSAHQRNDIQNYAQITGFFVNFGLMWLLFEGGHGVLSLAWATLFANMCSGLFCMAASWRLQFLPGPGYWGRVSWSRFRELFSYAQAMFFVALGTQLVIASQILIIQRCLGAGAATLWGLGVRMFQLVSQLIWRVSDMAGPAFCEMIVRGEKALLKIRFQEMVTLTASLSGFCAVGFVLCNTVFVEVWSGYTWSPWFDCGLATWMIISAVQRCHNGLVLLTKQVGFLRYLYFLEGIVFVGLALLMVKAGGIMSVILCSICCSLAFGMAYGVWRSHRYFQISAWEIGVRWLGLMGRTIGLCAPVALFSWWAVQWFEQAFLRLVISAGLYGTLASWLFLRFGLPLTFQSELALKAPGPARRLLRLVFPAAPSA